MPPGIGAYPDAGPLSGNVPSSRMDLAVTPGVAVDVAPAVITLPDATARAAASSRNVFFMLFLSFCGVTWGVVVCRTIRGLPADEKSGFTGIRHLSPGHSARVPRVSP